MASENQKVMDFDESSNESPDILRDNPNDNQGDICAPTSPPVSSCDEGVNENETENPQQAPVDTCDEDASRDSNASVEVSFDDKRAARSHSLSPSDTESPNPGKDSNPQEDDQDTEPYPITVDDSSQSSQEAMGNSNKKSKTSDDRDEPAQVRRSTSDNKDEPTQGGSTRQAPITQYFGFEGPRKPRLRKRYSDMDTEEYRRGYPGKVDDPRADDNLRFYTNKLKSTPNGDLIDNIHKHWLKQYYKLESHHGYIQWLFPIREQGMNHHAQELQLHEAKAIKSNEKAKERVRRSYELMLDFYGMRLKDKDTGKIERADNWRERFNHLNNSMHNHLRITRILKSLGELGYEHYQYPFVDFVLKEALDKRTLRSCVDSCCDYWVGTVKDDTQRRRLEAYIEKYSS